MISGFYHNVVTLRNESIARRSISHQMIEYGNILEWPPWAERLTRWNHVMLVTNSSVNIVIYVFQASKYFLKISL